MLTKRQFIGLYEEAVVLIKEFKMNNDKNNKNLGVVPYSQMLSEIQAEQSYIKKLIMKIENIEDKLGQNYLDPQTARKIGMIKQQLRIQTERRTHIFQTVKQEASTEAQNRVVPNKYQQIKAKVNKKNNPNQNYEFELPSQNFNNQNYSTHTQYSNKNSNSQTMITQEVQEYDFEFQARLIKQKNDQLTHVHNKMQNINNIAIETAQLTYKQGQNLDLIGQQIGTTYKNVKVVNKELSQAEQYQRRSKSKCIWCAVFIIIAAVLILVALFFAFSDSD